MDVTKIESNLLNLNKEHFKIKEIILNIINNYKNNLVKKNIKFECMFSDDDFVIYADKVRISQVLCNLINNSIKFISNDNDGTISISVEKRKKILMVMVLMVIT